MNLKISKISQMTYCLSEYAALSPSCVIIIEAPVILESPSSWLLQLTILIAISIEFKRNRQTKSVKRIVIQPQHF